CTYSIMPANNHFASGGGSGTVNVTVTAGCNWTATSNSSWITIPPGAGGTGNGVVNYSVGVNAGAGRTGTVTIAGQTFTVTQDMPANYQGFHDGAGCGTISGWAWDANNPTTTVSVDIYDGVNLIATTPSGMYREDLLNVLGSPNHGFSFPTPAALLNGAVHSISVKITGTSITLAGGPKNIRCSGAPNLQGSHDGAGCNTICGWAWNANDPGNIVNVDIYADGSLIGTIAATQYRQDVADIYGQPYHEFNFPTPASLRDGKRHIITVKFGGTTANLTWNTPKAFTCSSTSPTYQGSQDPASCNTISGYAWDTSDDNNIVNVAIYVDGAFFVVVPAQQVSAGIGNGYHGFAFTVPASLKNGQQHSILVRFSGTNTGLTNSPRTITCP